MTRKDVERLLDGYNRAWNEQDLDAIDAAHAPDVVFENHNAGERAEGAEAVRAHIAGIFERWPDLRFRGRRLYVADDFAVSEWTATATHPDGRRLEWDGVDVFPLRDGLIARKDVYSTAQAARVLGAGTRERDPLEALRELCLALPETTERPSHGEPTWFVRGKKVFVTYADHHHDDVLAFWCAAPPGAQEALVAADPERFFRPPYVGGRGWLGVRLDRPGVDWDEIAELVEDAWREVAPKRLVASFDEAR